MTLIKCYFQIIQQPKKKMGTVKIVLELKLQIFYFHMLVENHPSITKNLVEISVIDFFIALLHTKSEINPNSMMKTGCPRPNQVSLEGEVDSDHLLGSVLNYLQMLNTTLRISQLRVCKLV